ncbi:PKD domain-containing protein [Flavobacteriales bacterium]|nr:PKD domain-containing protein [Flavobacteriales bacterium]
MDTEIITVEADGDPTITPAGPFCPNDPAVTLVAATPGGIWSGTGITNPTLGTFNPTIAGSGNWTVTYTLPGACGGTDTEVINVTPAIAPNSSLDQQANCGQPDGIASVSPTGGTVANDYSYSWGTSPTQTAGTATGLGPGSYAITITDDLGCSITESVSVTSTAGFTASISNSTDASCDQLCNGTATVITNAGSIGALTYSWGTTPPQTTATATGLCQGMRSVTVTDNVGCTAIATATITAPPAFTAAASVSPSPICFSESATLSATPNGGSTPYTTYSWTANPADPTLTTPTAQNPTVSPTGYTSYSVTVTDANGCTATGQTALDVGTEMTLTPELIQQSNCGQADGILTVAVAGGFADTAYVYSWDTTPIQTEDTISGLLPGTYNVTVTDDLGCTATTSATVTTSAGFTAAISSSTDASCNLLCDGEATVTTSGTTVPPLSYSWDTTPVQTTATATNLCAGNYDVSVTDATGCSTTASIIITEPAAFTVATSASTIQICAGETSDLTATTAGGSTPIASYAWTSVPTDPSLTASTQNPTVSPTTNTVYTVVVTDAGGCTATNQVTVNASPAIVLNAVMDQQSNCGQADGAVSVSGTGGTVANDYVYSWSSAPVQTTAVATGLLPATYSVTVTDDLGCSETTTATVTSSAGFTASISSYQDASCNQVCDGTATVLESTGTVPPLTYSWNTTPVQTTATATNLCAGNYDVTLTDATGCATTASVAIAEPPSLSVTVAASASPLCSGQTSNLAAAPTGGSLNNPVYTWTATPTDASLTASDQNPTVSPLQNTVYEVTVTDDNGCTATSQVSVDVSPGITLTAVMDQQSNCGQSDGAVSVSASGGTVATDYSYSWDSSPLQTTAAATGLPPATYTVTVTDDVGCTQTATADVTTSGGFTASLSASTDASCNQVCDGTATVVTSGTIVAPLTYSWNTSPVQTIDAATNLCAGNYDVVVTDNVGCTATASVTIAEPAAITVTAAASQTLVCGGQTSDLTAVSNGGSAPITFGWTATPADPLLNATIQDQTVSPTANTVYQVTATDATGCTATDQVSVNVSPGITLIAVMDQQSNCGQSDGEVSVSASGGTVANDYSYSWDSSPVQTTAVATGLPPATYTVTVTDDVGCTETATADVITSGGFTANITASTDATCFQGCDGTATAEALVGTVPPLSYSWNTTPVQTTATATGLCAGTYNVSVTDNTGCVGTATVIITEPAELEVTAATSAAAICLGGSADLTATPSGGALTNPTYAWTATPADLSLNPVAQNPTVTPLVNTVYEVTLTDDNGCTATDQLSVDISSALTVVGTLDQVSNCGQPDGVVSATASGGTVAVDYSYNWNTTPVQTTATATGLSPGTYTVVATDDAGCAGTTDVIVTQTAGFTASISSSTDASCFEICDGTATAEADIDAVVPVTYSWNTIPVQTGATATGLCAGTCDVTVTDAAGCIATATAIIGEPTELIANASTSAATICSGETSNITAAASGGTQPVVSFSWSATPADPSLITTDQSPAVSPAVSTTYTYTATDSNGCNATDQVTVDISPAVIPSAAMDQQSNCGQPDGIVTASATGGTVAAGYSYSWDSTPTQSTATATGLAPTIYTVTVTDDLGCSEITTVEVTSTAGFTASISAFTGATCYQLCDGTATVIETAGAIAPITYSWNTSPIQNGATATGLCAGTYIGTLTDATGCAATATITIGEPTILEVLATTSVSPICIGQSANLTSDATGGTQPYTYAWTASPVDASLNAATQNPTVSPLANTTYTVTATDDNGCTETALVDVLVNDALSLSFNRPSISADTSICPYDQATLDLTATGGDGTYTYYLQPDLATPVTFPMLDQPTITTSYEFVVEDGCGTPSATASSIITVLTLPTIQIDAEPDSGCHPLTVDFTDVTSPAPIGWNWNFGDSQSSNNTSNLTTPTHSFSNPGLYDVSLSVNLANGCTVDTTFADFVESFPLPNAAFSLDPARTTVLLGKVTFTDESTGDIATWDWNFGTGDLSTEQHPVYNYTDTGTFPIWLTVTSVNGCEATARGQVIIEPDFSFYVPNAFTPGADGLNDRFRGYGEGVQWDTYEIGIHNRWGEQIFYSKDVEQGWDGTFKGLDVPNEVYVWWIKVQDIKGALHNYRGHVTVVR